MKIRPSTTLHFLLVFILHPSINGMSLPTASPAEEAALIEIDPHFSLNLADLEGREISRTLQTISGAVMGTAEIAMGIRSDLKFLRKEIMMGKMNMRFEGRQNPEPASTSQEERQQNLVLENILGLKNSSSALEGVDLSKEDVQKIITTNFIRILSAMLVNGPPSTQRRKDDILKLMRSVLNGELDFKAVVEKLPFILKESETNQFIILIQTIKEDEFLPKLQIKGRQEDEDEDGEDEVVTAAPVVAATVPATAEYQETVIFVPRPQQGQGQGSPGQTSSSTSSIGVGNGVSVSGGGGPQVITVATNNKTAASAPQTQAPLRIVVRQPQPKPAPTPPSTMKPRTQFQKITDAVGQLNVNQFQGLIDSLPDLFAGIDGLVDGVEGIIGDQPTP